MQYVSHLNGGRVRDIKVPVFTIGDEDGRAVEQMNAAAKGVGLKTHVRWDVGEYPDLKQDIVIGKLPGMTDENIVMLSHTDGFFEGAADNAAGTAAMLGTASILPKCRRKNAAGPCTSSRCSIITAAIAARNGCTTIFNRYSRRPP